MTCSTASRITCIGKKAGGGGRDALAAGDLAERGIGIGGANGVRRDRVVVTTTKFDVAFAGGLVLTGEAGNSGVPLPA